MNNMSAAELYEPADKEVISALLAKFPLLAKDPYFERVSRTGMPDNGKLINNLEDFATIRNAFLEIATSNVAKKNPAAFDAAVVSSVAPEIEKYSVN